MTNVSKAHLSKSRNPSDLKISEIFYSLQGEARTAGIPTVFVRLTGCPLRCVYCDTEYAFRGGDWMSRRDVLAEIAVHQASYVCVTGGEPLAQKACIPLLESLCDHSYQVSLETSGAMDITDVDARVAIVLDMKTPKSGEMNRNLYSNLEQLSDKDTVKFVIADREDFDWSRKLIAENDLAPRCEIIFSPVYGSLKPSDLAGWILDQHLPVRMQLQLHKIVWGDERGR